MSNESAPSNGSISVLICDDDEETGSGRSLEVVGEARDGNEAISEAQRLQPDVILLDLSMPHRTGLEALPEIKEVAPAAGVIVFSGFDSSTMASEVLSRGADRYLEKGARPSEITTAIQEVAALTQPV